MLDNTEFDDGSGGDSLPQDSYSNTEPSVATPPEPDLVGSQLTLRGVSSGSFGPDYAPDFYRAPDLAAERIQQQFPSPVAYAEPSAPSTFSFAPKGPQQAGAPDRLALDAPELAAAGDPLSHGIENIFGTLEALPGIGGILSPLGDALGSLGRSMEGSALANAAGGAEDLVGKGFELALGSPVLGGALQSVLSLAGAATKRVGEVFDQYGKSAAEVGDARDRLVTGKGSIADFIGSIVDSTIAAVSSPFTGSLWRDSDPSRHPGEGFWGAAKTVNIGGAEVPQDLLDSAEILSAIGAGKVAGLAKTAFAETELGSGLFGGISRATRGIAGAVDRVVPQPVQDFAYGFQRAGRGFDVKALAENDVISASQKLGHYSGATVAAMTGLGAAEQLVLQTDALKDTDFAKSVMGNRFGPEDAKWRMPYSLAVTWPLDLAGIAEAANTAKWAAFARDRLAGPPTTAVHQFYGGVDNMTRLVNEGKATWQGFSDEYEYAQLQFAREKLADEAMVGYDAKAAGWTDAQLAEPRALERIREEALNAHYGSDADFKAALDQKMSELGNDRSFDTQVHDMMLRDAESAGLNTPDDRALNWRDYSKNMTDLQQLGSDLVLGRNDRPTSWGYQQAAATVDKLQGGLTEGTFNSLVRDNPSIVNDLRQNGIVTYADLKVKTDNGWDLGKWMEKRSESLRKQELGDKSASSVDKLTQTGKGVATPNPDVQAVADRYLKRAGLPPAPRFAPVRVDETTAREIADLYDRAKSKPNDPRVRAAYEAFNKETEAQWRLVSRNVKVERWTKPGQPYANSAEMRADVLNNKHLYVFDGGSEIHPLMTNEQNFRFRAVHDYFGHALNGFEFGPRGEENAWVAHSQMYGKQARGAMTTETRAQNSWVNFGPHAQQNRAAYSAGNGTSVANDLEQQAARAGMKSQAQLDTLRKQLEDIAARETKATGSISAETRSKLDALATEKPFTGDFKYADQKAMLLPERYWSRPDIVSVPALEQRAAELSPMEKVRTRLGQLYADQYKAEEAGDAAKLRSVKADIAKVKEARLNDIAQAHAALDAKELQRFAMAFDNPTGGRAVQALLDAMKGDISRAHALLSEEEMTLNLLGTRWRLEEPPKGSTVMRVTEGIGGKDVSVAERKSLGRAYDLIFGPVSNRQLRDEWMTKTYAEANARGLTTTKVDQFFTKLKKLADESTESGGYRVTPTIRSLSSETVNKVGREVFGAAAPQGMKSWVQFLDYHHPGPVPHFIEKLTGKEFHYPAWYADHYHELVAHAYPLFRFYLDPRWRLMNIPEKGIEAVARTGVSALGRTASTDAVQLARLHGVQDAEQLGVPTTSIIEKRLSAERLGAMLDSAWADQATNAFMDSLMQDKTMQGLVAHYGGEKAAFRAVADNLVDIGRTLSARTGASKDVARLEAEVRTLRQQRNVPGLPADRLLDLDQKLFEKGSQLKYATVRSQALEAAGKDALESEKLLHPVYSAIASSRVQTLQDLEHALEGSPTRSEAQRVLNSYLLYWPLSYQFRVGKQLARLLTSQVAGVHSGMAPFALYATMRTQHEQRMQSDKAYAESFKRQDAVLQLFEQLLPITPEGLGLTLGAPTRIVEHLATGRFDAVRDLERLWHIGPVLTSGIADRIVSQEAGNAKPSHDLHLNESTLGQTPMVP